MIGSAHRRFGGAVITLAALLILASPAAQARHRHSRHQRLLGEDFEGSVILAFGTMYGVDGGFVGGVNPIRNTPGDDAAWKLTSARGFLTTSGHLRIHVRGLIFADGTPNDDDEFRARVSCLTEDELGGTPVADVTTEGFAADPAGDSDIDAQLTLPSPCVAPIVFILGGDEDKWFAVNGFEAGESSGNGDDGDDDHDGNGDNDDDDDQGEDD